MEKVVFEGCDHVWEPGFTPRMVETVVRWVGRQGLRVEG